MLRERVRSPPEARGAAAEARSSILHARWPGYFWSGYLTARENRKILENNLPPPTSIRSGGGQNLQKDAVRNLKIQQKKRY